MELVVNSEYGGYSIPKEICKKTGLKQYDDSIEARTNPEFIAWVQAHMESELSVAVIPAEATDFIIQEYDGLETVLYVLDGKIQYA